MQTYNRYIFVHSPYHGGLPVPATLTFGLDHETKTVRYGISFCSPKDNFSRKAGREAAYKIMMDPNHKWAGQWSFDFVLALVNDYVSNFAFGLEVSDINDVKRSWLADEILETVFQHKYVHRSDYLKSL